MLILPRRAFLAGMAAALAAPAIVRAESLMKLPPQPKLRPSLIAAGSTITIVGLSGGTLHLGARIHGFGLPEAGAVIVAQVSGAPGGAGTYLWENEKVEWS